MRPILTLRHLILSTSLIGLLGCSGSSQVNSEGKLNSKDSSESNIVGGDLASSKDLGESAVVNLIVKSSGDIFCTGTLIHPRIVLTAAHCLALTNFTADDIKVGFAAVSGQTRAVDDTNYHDDFGQVVSGGIFGTSVHLKNDIALLLLTSSAPSAAHPAKLPSSEMSVGTQVKVKIYGYGYTDSAVPYVDGHLRTVTKSATVPEDFPAALVDDETDGHGTCNGDSGGPAFLIGSSSQPTVVGLVSNTITAAGFLGTSVGDRCKQMNQLTQVGSHLQWVKETMNQMLSN